MRDPSQTDPARDRARARAHAAAKVESLPPARLDPEPDTWPGLHLFFAGVVTGLSVAATLVWLAIWWQR